MGRGGAEATERRQNRSSGVHAAEPGREATRTRRPKAPPSHAGLMGGGGKRARVDVGRLGVDKNEAGCGFGENPYPAVMF